MTAEARRGTIVTFYSYKGGVGRSMALANVGWLLASNGKRVLMVDWDLESPGLHRFFHPLLLDVQMGSTRGLMNLVWEFALAAVTPAPDEELAPDWHLAYADVSPYIVSVDWPFAGGGQLHLMPAGRQDDAYASRVSSFDWRGFYERLGGGPFLEAVKDAMRAGYDYVLVDSRTGLSDTSGICTVQMPDVLVCCSTLSIQSIEGSAAVARSVRRQRREPGFRILPLLMRVDDGEHLKAEAGRYYARRVFEDVLGLEPGEERERYWGEMEVPYRRFYAYEEVMATVADRPLVEGTLLSALERLTARLTDGLVTAIKPDPDAERLRLLARFERGAPDERRADFFMSYSAADRDWATWIAWVLSEAGFTVLLDVWQTGTDDHPGRGPAADDADRVVAVVSHDYVTSIFRRDEALSRAGAESRLVPVVVASADQPPALAAILSIDLRGFDEVSCRQLLLSGLAAGTPRPQSRGVAAGRPAGLRQPPFPRAGGRQQLPRVETPMLAIFAGTTAGVAALEFMRHARELPEADRRRVAIVHIDTDHLHPDLAAFRSRDAGLFNEKVIRIGVPRHIAYIPRIEQDGDPGEPYTYAGARVPDPFANGARGIRNNAHVAFCYDAPEIIKSLEDAVSQITSRDASDDLPLPRSVRVHVISFIGGGTGGGIMADLACLARQLVAAADLDPIVELSCILPDDVDHDGAELRRSNAAACLLEILALSVASGPDGTGYRQWLRHRVDDIPLGPIAQEVHLVGSKSGRDSRETARIAGMDLFQRAQDASGVGALERSEAPNRLSLGSLDEVGLPMMFGTICPVDVRFPTRETALVFAQRAASAVLALLVEELNDPVPEEAEQRPWSQLWSRRWVLAAITTVLLDLRLDRYADLEESDLYTLWQGVEEVAAAITRRLEALGEEEREQQRARIAAAGATLEARARHWQWLQREYEHALADLHERFESAPARPIELERPALRRLWRRRRAERRLYEAHRTYLEHHAAYERRRLLLRVLADLSERAGNLYRRALSDARQAEAELRRRVAASPAWSGRLDVPHPFQLHALDLDALGRTGGASPPVQRLYRRVTIEIGGVGEDGQPAYRGFLRDVTGSGVEDWEQLSQRAVGYFQTRYLSKLQSVSLLQIMEYAAGGDPGGPDTVDAALAELMRRVRAVMTDNVPFDGTWAFRSEVFLSYSAGSEGEGARIREIAAREGLLRAGADHFLPNRDMHRLQATCLRHAISLGRFNDFSPAADGAMAAYLRHKEAWSRSPAPTGPPPHTCTALERLVSELQVAERVVRLPPTPV